MNVTFQRFEDEIEGDLNGQPVVLSSPAFGERLRELLRVLEASFRKIRVDGPLIVGGGATINRHLSATATWDPANLNAGTQTTTTITVTGAVLGDVVGVSFSQDLQGMQLTGYVSAADTVTVVLRNGTAGAINLASGTLRATVTQY